MNSLVYNAKPIDTFKKFKSLSEDLFVSAIFTNSLALTKTARANAISYLATFLSQIAGKDLGQAEPMLLKLTAGQLTSDQTDFLKNVFSQLSRLCFQKKVKEQLDVQFHTYLAPEVNQDSLEEYADNPETQIILDALMAKEPSEKLIEIIQTEQVFIYCLLTKCKKSLEHLKQSVEKYRKVFTSLYASTKAQRLIVEMVLAVFGPAENDEMRDKAAKVIQKLCQIRVLSNQTVIEWAVANMQSKGSKLIELDLILQAL
jgi:hypothetical protein